MSSYELIKLVFFTIVLLFFSISGIRKIMTAKQMPRDEGEHLAAFRKKRDGGIRDLILGIGIGGINTLMIILKTT